MENLRISAHYHRTCGWPAVTSPRPRLRTSLWINHTADDRLDHQVRQNRQIRQIHRYHCPSVDTYAPGFDFGTLAQRQKDSEKNHGEADPRNRLSSASSASLQLGSIARATQADAQAHTRMMCSRRLVQGLQFVVAIRAAQNRAARFCPSARKIPCSEDHTKKSADIGIASASIMTWRIERCVIEEDRAVLCVSGRIQDQDVAALRASLEQGSGVVAIDLKDVLIVDRDAIPLFAACESQGVELRNCPAYIREWITRDEAGKNVSKGRMKTNGETEDA